MKKLFHAILGAAMGALFVASGGCERRPPPPDPCEAFTHCTSTADCGGNPCAETGCGMVCK